MLHFMRKLPNANTVVAGGTSTFQVPLGPTYRSFYLKYSTGADVPAPEATMASDLLRVRIKINGITRFDVSGANWLTLIKRYGYSIKDGVFPIMLARKYARLVAGEENTAWGTRNLETLTVEVDLKSGVTTPKLELEAEQTPESRDLGPIIQVLSHNFDSSTSGQVEISNLPRTNGNLAALHFFTDKITALNVQLDSVDYFDAALDTAEHVYSEKGRVAQASLVSVEPTYLDRLDDTWPLAAAQDFRVKATLSAAASIPIVMETAIVLPLPSSA